MSKVKSNPLDKYQEFYDISLSPRTYYTEENESPNNNPKSTYYPSYDEPYNPSFHAIHDAPYDYPEGPDSKGCVLNGPESQIDERIVCVVAEPEEDELLGVVTLNPHDVDEVYHDSTQVADVLLDALIGALTPAK